MCCLCSTPKENGESSVNDYQPLFADIDENLSRYLDELKSFLRIPSISTDPGNEKEIRKAAEWMLDRLGKLGFDAELMETPGWPIVMAKRETGSSDKWCMIYGHYDVQPEAPREKWNTDPFEPTEKDGVIYCRGINDDKGQMCTYISAIDTYLRVKGNLPFNILFVAEGEEEVGSKSLLKLLKDKPELFKSDVFVMSDSSMLAKGLPAITYGFRGIMAMEVSVRTMGRDLHSGLFGGIALNAGEVLAKVLSSLKDEDGHVVVEGFYDNVGPIGAREKELMSEVAYNEEETAHSLGMAVLYGESGYTGMERKSARPTLDINGFWTGYTAEGFKTVIPAEASAKISCRLVPGQEPMTIFDAIKKHIIEKLPKEVKADFVYHFGAFPVGVSLNDDKLILAQEAITEGFGIKPKFIRSGGTVHIVSEIKNHVKIPSLLILGWGRPENGSHSPNECFYIDDYKNATRSLCVLFDSLFDKS